jgi:hypothetical protein
LFGEGSGSALGILNVREQGRKKRRRNSMKTNSEHKEVVEQIANRGLMFTALLAVTLLAAGICRAQTSAAPSPNVDAKSATTGATAVAPVVGTKSVPPPANMLAAPRAQSSSQGPRDAITVHGYWVIDIRNPDGRIAKHMEFENQLCTSFVDGYNGGGVGGDSILASLLESTATPGAWAMVVGEPDASGLSQPNCAIAPYAYLNQAGATASSIYGTSFSNNGFVSGPVDGLPLAMSCIFSNPSGINISFPGSNNVTNHCDPVLTESPGPSGPGIVLSAQFNSPTNVPISAVGTELFTCMGSPGPPRPGDCLKIGPQAVNSLGLPNSPCTIQGTGATPNPVSSVTFTGCLPGDTTSIVTINSERVTNIPGRAPFSGVILTGTNGVPGPFTIGTGQTAVVTWTLSFQ